jgi:adhesin transport system membrane fusion protein
MAVMTPMIPAARLNLPSLQISRTPRFVRLFARLLLLFLILCVPGLALAPWTQTVHGIGRAIAFNPVKRPQFIISPIEGRVKKWFVVEGDKVKAGDLLVELVDNDPMILERLREQETLALQRLALAEGRVIDQEARLQFVKGEREVLLAEADARIQQAAAQVLVAKQELQQALFNLEREKLNYDRLYKLYTSPLGELASKDQVEEAERKLNLAKAQVPLVEARVMLALKSQEAAERQRDATDNRTNALIQTEEAALKAAQSEKASVQQQYNSIKIQVERQSNQKIYAPATGTVFRILANAEAGGQLVRPGERLAVLVPDIKQQDVTPLENAILSVTGGSGMIATAGVNDENLPGIVAELFIDGNDLPLVRVGDPVLLQFEGWAAVQFAAFPQAAAGTFDGRVYLVDPTADEVGKFRILVEPAPGANWPEEDYLRQGVRAQGWVIVNTVRLGYEIWRLLNGFPPAREVDKKPSGQRLGPVGGK